jgi:biotin carboxyl carrier protein
MKMKNIIRSNHEGTIASIEVSEGQKVAYGAPLVRFA